MKPLYKVVIAAGFIGLYGMQAVMFILLMRPDGIRIHAPMPGIAVPLETTVVGDAWMKGGAQSIEVLARNAQTGETLTAPVDRDTIRYHGQAVSVLAAWHAAMTFPAPGDWVISARVTAVTDGRALEAAPRTVSASAAAASRQFVFLSLPHILALLVVLAWSALVPFLVRRSGSAVVRDRVALIMTLAIWIHEVAYEIYWFIIGAFTVGNALLFHMCALALMFLPFVYFSKDGRFRQYTFELVYFFGLGGAMQALLTPDIWMHGFPEFKYFAFFVSHGMFVLGAVYAAWVYRLPLRLMSVVRIAVGTVALALLFYGIKGQLLRHGLPAAHGIDHRRVRRHLRARPALPGRPHSHGHRAHRPPHGSLLARVAGPQAEGLNRGPVRSSVRVAGGRRRYPTMAVR